MTILEIIQQADEEITYPFETVIEKYLPWADAISDVVCTAVFVMEDVFNGQGMGATKKDMLLSIMGALWDRAPIPAWAKGFLDQLFSMSMNAFIDVVVDWLNKKFPDGFGVVLANEE